MLVVTRAYNPQTGVGYKFDINDYSRYGMPKRIEAQRGMGIDLYGSPHGTTIARTDYTYGDSSALGDAPEFTQREEWADGNAGSPATTGIWTYDRSGGRVAPQWTAVTQPSGLKVKSSTNSSGALSLVESIDPATQAVLQQTS